VDHDIVAQLFEPLAREYVVLALGFLQANDVRRLGGQPGHQVFDPLIDGIDVPGSDPHGLALQRWSKINLT
jgi:hypothetical protein